MSTPQGEHKAGGSPDRIHIRDLLVRGIVGINEGERKKRQDILLNLTLHADVRRAGETDSIDDAVNYRTVAKSIIEMVEKSSFFTVEKLATEVARLVLSDFAVTRLEVTVEKPGALRFARTVGVSIDRTPKDFI